MGAKLYVVPGSHPSAAVAYALEMKGIPFDRVDLLPVVHKGVTYALFRRSNVPALKLDDEKVTGSRTIMHRLDEVAPEPALYPADPEARARVEEADQWGEEVLQAAARRLSWAALVRRPKAMRSFVGDAKLPIPVGLAMTSAGLVARSEVWMNHAGSEAARADVQALPGWMDHVDELIADGVIGGEEPNAADLQIASSVRLLLTIGDLSPVVDGRPAADLARRLFGDFAGEVPAGTLPAEWLPAYSGGPATRTS
jgi:glutathione S-transferase